MTNDKLLEQIAEIDASLAVALEGLADQRAGLVEKAEAEKQALFMARADAVSAETSAAVEAMAKDAEDRAAQAEASRAAARSAQEARYAEAMDAAGLDLAGNPKPPRKAAKAAASATTGK